MTYTYYSTELYHHGIKGMRWGVRRYQNEDGTRTAAGKVHDAKMQYKADIKSAKQKYKSDRNGSDSQYANAKDRYKSAKAKALAKRQKSELSAYNYKGDSNYAKKLTGKRSDHATRMMRAKNEYGSLKQRKIRSAMKVAAGISMYALSSGGSQKLVERGNYAAAGALAIGGGIGAGRLIGSGLGGFLNASVDQSNARNKKR